MEKPTKPEEPKPSQFPRETPVSKNSPYVKAYRAWQKKQEQYEKDLYLYEQTKLIRFVKNADIKLILSKYEIVKKGNGTAQPQYAEPVALKDVKTFLRKK